MPHYPAMFNRCRLSPREPATSAAAVELPEPTSEDGAWKFDGILWGVDMASNQL